ncbi:MAG: acetate--CoA ligase family protein [Syntrophales bacterium]
MRKFLEPESVIVIGAPRKSGPGTFNNVEIMLRYGYKGRIYPINPNADEICGIKTYPSVADVPEVADLAVISVGRDRVMRMFEDCVRAGIQRVIIISQGFADADSRGAELQREIVKLAHAEGVRVIGPNTMGVINNFNHFTTSFVDFPFPDSFMPVSLIAQTGFFQVASRNLAYKNWGKAIDIGNTSDVDFVDALNYLEDDPETKVICIHMEGLKRGREFIESASRVSLRKPIIVLKTGRSRAGAKAALSHSGSLVGEDEVFDAAFRRAGIIRVKDEKEMRDAMHALLLLGEMKGPRMGVLTVTGAGGIISADAAEEFGLVLSDLPEGLPEKLRKGMPQWIHVGNPIDIWPIGMIGGNYAGVFEEALKDLLIAPQVDGVLAIFPVSKSPLHSNFDLTGALRSARESAGNSKPVAIWDYIDSELFIDEFEQISGIACFDHIEQAVQGLSFSHRYYRIKNRRKPAVRTFSYEHTETSGLLILGKEQGYLSGGEALSFLKSFGLPVIESRLARSDEEVMDRADEIGFPLVLKLAGPAFLHKSEWGGVITGIKSKEELAFSIRKIRENVKSRDNGAVVDLFEVQRQAQGKELLIGLKKDPQFGHVIACGLGGIYTEVFRDVSREIVPIGRAEAEDMIRTLKIFPILKGVRGEEGVDLGAVYEALERISFMALEVPEIQELDMNPFIVSSTFCAAVDARIIF